MLKYRLKIICIYLIIFIGILYSSFYSFADENNSGSKIKMNFTYGYENFAKTGRYLTVSMKLENEGDIFDGNISFYLDSSERDKYVYTYPLYMLQGEKKQEKYTVFITGNTSKINIRVSSNKGDTPAVGSIDFTKGTDNITLLIGTLSDTPGLLDYFDDISVNYGLMKTKTVNLSTDNFPEDSRELEQLDIIIISNYRIRDLSYEQSSALMDWVKNGGVMLLGTGFRVDDTLGRYAPELLDNIYEKPELRDIDLNSMLEKYEQSYIQKLPIVDISLHGGEVLFYQKDLPLISSVNKEQGKIAVAAYDFINIYNYAKNHPEYVSRIISAVVGNKRIEQISTGTFGLRNSLHTSIQSIIGIGDIIKVPSIRLYTFFAILYVIIIGPLLYILLKRRNLLHLYKKILVFISVVVSFVIFIIGTGTRFTNTFYNYINILDVSESEIEENTFINIRNPYVRDYDVYVAPEYSIIPLDNSLRYSQNAGNKSGVWINTDKELTTINIDSNIAFEPHYFSIERKHENVDNIGTVSNISLFKNNISGTLTNNYTGDLKDAILLFYGKIVVLGDIRVGETKDLSSLEVINIPITNYYEIASKITGIESVENKDLNNKDYIELVKKTNLLSFYMSNFIYGYSQDAKIVAFLKDTDKEGRNILNSELKFSGMSLFTGTLNVDNKQDGESYRQVLLKTPTTVSGEYYPEINSIYASEPAILEYHLGTDMNITELIFEDLSEEFTTNIPKFSGRIYFYNIITEEYDRIDSNKKEFSMQELENYLSENNDIRIRYVHDNGEKQNIGVALPIISVVGIER